MFHIFKDNFAEYRLFCRFYQFFLITDKNYIVNAYHCLSVEKNYIHIC